MIFDTSSGSSISRSIRVIHAFPRGSAAFGANPDWIEPELSVCYEFKNSRGLALAKLLL